MADNRTCEVPQFLKLPNYSLASNANQWAKDCSIENKKAIMLLSKPLALCRYTSLILKDNNIAWEIHLEITSFDKE